MPVATDTIAITLEHNKLDELAKRSQEREDLIAKIKAEISQPVDANNPVPLFNQLNRTS